MQEGIEKENQAWNVAQGYVQLKILKQLVELDQLVMRARYGSEEQTISQMLTQEQKTEAKIEAIQRLIDTLKLIFENAHFSMHKADTQKKLEELENEVNEIENTLDAIYEIKTNEVSKRDVTQLTTHFHLCLDKLRTIKQKIPNLLNINGLIFSQSDEIDLEKIKKRLIDDG